MKKLITLSFLAATLAFQARAEVLEHFIMDGQSLSTGHQSWPIVSTENVEGNYMLGDQIWINYGARTTRNLNPLIGKVSNDFANARDNGSRNSGAIAECPLLGVVNHLQLKYHPGGILATSVGVSGATVEELSKGCQNVDNYQYFTRAISNARQAVRNTDWTLHCPAIFWMQGEFNYQVKSNPCGMLKGEYNTTDKSEYKALMLQLKSDMQSHIMSAYSQEDAPVWIEYQVGAQYVRDRIAIGMAQLEAANENDDVIMAGPIYPMTDRGGHLDANGYRWFGEMLAKVYYRTQVLKESFSPLQPKRIARENGGKTLRVTFHVPYRPMVFDTNTLPKIKNYGFNVYQNGYGSGSRQEIKSITIEGDDVVMTFSKALTGDIYVTYGDPLALIENQPSGLNHLQGHGNLRDSDPYEGVLEYIDLDGKDAEGNYIYWRNESETRLRPDYEPKDENGNVIYGQHYPLQNYAVSFLYRLRKKVDVLEILDEDLRPIPMAEAVEGTLTDIYLDPKGSDDNSGQWSHSPVATLQKALSVAKWSGARIHVSGKISIKEPVELENFKDLWIIGTNEKACLDGGTKYSLLEATGCDLYFRDITLSNFYSENEGSCMRLTKGSLRMDNCKLDNCKTSYISGANGAIAMRNGDIKLNSCTISNNWAYSGGAIYLNGGNIVARDCKFDSNRVFSGANETDKGNSRGGMMHITAGSADFFNCTFNSNRSQDSGGVVYVLFSYVPNLHVNFIGCDLTGNSSGAHSGVIYTHNTVDNGFTVNMINCTLNNNRANACGGIYWMIDGSSSPTQAFNMINCTAIGNYTNSGSWHCGGLRFFTNQAKVNIVNTILEGNYGLQNDGVYTDLHISKYDESNAKNFNIKNSIIGRFVAEDECTLTELQCEASAVNVSPATRNEGPSNFAGMGEMMTSPRAYFPVKTLDSPAATMGNDALLAEFGYTTDQFGRERTRNFIGAVDLLDGEDGIADAIADRLSDLLIVPTALGVMAISPRNGVAIDVYDLAGKRILGTTTAETTASIDMNRLSSGLYIVKAQSGTSTSILKLVR